MAQKTETSRTRLLRLTAVQADKNPTSKTAIYDAINDGTWPPGIKLGKRTVAWLEHECDAVLNARVRGASDEEVRTLVAELIADREAA